MRLPFIALAVALCQATPALAEFHTGTPAACTDDGWQDKSDADFASDCAGMAFAGPAADNLLNRQKLAWMFFTRVNKMVPDTAGVSADGMVPLWMTWPTDDETFTADPDFAFDGDNRSFIAEVVPKTVLAGNDFKGGAEEVVRNRIGYEYLTDPQHPLTTAANVKAFFAADRQVQMPVGSVEIKASWAKVDGTAPDGAKVYSFDKGDYWFRGMHIMVKMQPAPPGREQFTSESPSWFWTTFEYSNDDNTGDSGVTHVREEFITQRAPVDPAEVDSILKANGLQDAGYLPDYKPNGTQIRFTVDGKGTQDIHMGHTIMECFAGVETSDNCPLDTDPTDWTAFNASCHTCHSGANVEPEAENFCFFSFTSVLGVFGADTLPETYQAVDFMWPIPFNIYSVGDAPNPPDC